MRATYRGPRSLGLTRKQLELRRTVIGGTDAAAILGLSTWRGPHDVYAEKVGLAPPRTEDPSEPATWGLLLEPVLRWRYEQRTGRRITVPRGLRRHARYRWLAGHLDGLDEAGVVEFKTVRGGAGLGPDGSDEVRADWRTQVTHYEAVTDAPGGHVAVLIGGQDFRILTVERDEADVRDLVAEEAEFRVDHILARVPPAPDGSPGSGALARMLYPVASTIGEERIALPGATWNAIADLLRAREAETAAAREAERLKQVVMLAMGEAVRLLSPMATISWTQADRRETEWSEYTAKLRELALALGAREEELDALRAAYSTVRQVRQFRVQPLGPPFATTWDDAPPEALPAPTEEVPT